MPDNHIARLNLTLLKVSIRNALWQANQAQCAAYRMLDEDAGLPDDCVGIAAELCSRLRAAIGTLDNMQSQADELRAQYERITGTQVHQP